MLKCHRMYKKTHLPLYLFTEVIKSSMVEWKEKLTHGLENNICPL